MRAITLVLCVFFTNVTIFGRVVRDSLPELCDEFSYTLRLESPRTKSAKVHMSFGSGHSLVFDVISMADGADGSSYPAAFVLRNSSDSVICRAQGFATVDASERGFGIRLRGNAAGLSISMGGPESQIKGFCPSFPVSKAAYIESDVPDGIKEMRRLLNTSALECQQYSSFGSLDSLQEYLRNSSDPREGYYVYLDKDIDPSGPASITRPEYWRFASVASEDGGYMLIRVDDGARGWKALEVKAVMRPSGFIGHFDLEWRDAARRMHSTDTWAQFNENASIVSLNFPLFNAKIRLRKIGF